MFAARKLPLVAELMRNAANCRRKFLRKQTIEKGFKSTVVSSRKRSEIGNFCGIWFIKVREKFKRGKINKNILLKYAVRVHSSCIL